jgi:hypothetical protein
VPVMAKISINQSINNTKEGEKRNTIFVTTENQTVIILES